jgi:hypothetical protein
METPKGKEIQKSDDQIDLSHNNILRPYKIQKLDVPSLSYGKNQEPDSSSYQNLDIPSLLNGRNQEPGSSSYHDQHYVPECNNSPAYEIPEDYQTSGNQEIGGDNMNSEGPFFMYEEEVLGEGLKQCKNNIIGKLLAQKQISKQVLFSSLSGIWCNPAGFKITELENNLYQFTFEKESDINRILKGEPWIIRNVWLKLYLWNRNTNIQELDFSHAPLWIKVWGLPLHCKTVEMGHQLGAQIGKVEEAAIYEYPNNAKIIKVKIQFNLSNPVLAGMYIGNQNDGINWVDFRYENLPLVCFKCGLIGHSNENCEDSSAELPEGAVNPRGPWLRSNVYGRRIHDTRDQKFHSNPMKSVSAKQYSPIPKAMLDMMENLRIRKAQSGQGNTNGASTTTSSTHGWKDQSMQKPNPLKRKSLPASHTIQAHQTTTQDLIMASLGGKAGQQP